MQSLVSEERYGHGRYLLCASITGRACRKAIRDHSLACSEKASIMSSKPLHFSMSPGPDASGNPVTGLFPCSVSSSTLPRLMAC